MFTVEDAKAQVLMRKQITSIRINRLEALMEDGGLNWNEAANYRQMQRELSQLEFAHQQINDGTYGLCLNCYQPISLERLEWFPQAVSCMACLKGEKKHLIGYHYS